MSRKQSFLDQRKRAIDERARSRAKTNNLLMIDILPPPPKNNFDMEAHFNAIALSFRIPDEMFGVNFAMLAESFSVTITAQNRQIEDLRAKLAYAEESIDVLTNELNRAQGKELQEVHRHAKCIVVYLPPRLHGLAWVQEAINEFVKTL